MNKNEYKEAVNKIVISNELREKIIHNSSEKKTHKYKRNNIYQHFQKAAGLAACFAFCMLSYYAVTKYYHFPVDISTNTTTPSIQAQDHSDRSDTKNNAIASVPPDIDNIQNNTDISNEQHLPNNTGHAATAATSSAPRTTNNSVKTDHSPNTDYSVNTDNPMNTDNSMNTDHSVNADNSLPILGANQPTQSNSSDTEHIKQDDFPPMVGMPPSTDTNTPIENIVGNENAGGVCSGYTDENMATIAEIEQALGYDIKIPHYVPDDYKTDSLSAPFSEFAQIIYTNETDTLYYRTAKSAEDISGDYNNYTEIETVVMNDNDVTIKGNNNLYHNAIWFADDEAFSIYSNNGIEKDTMIDIVKGVE